MIYQENRLESYVRRFLAKMKKRLHSIVFSLFCLLTAFYITYYDEFRSKEKIPEFTPEEVTAPNLVSEEPLSVQAGDTLHSILANLNLDSTQIHKAITALRPLFNPKDLRPNHDLYVTTSPQEDGTQRNLLTLIIRPDITTEIILEQKEDGTYEATKSKRELERHVKYFAGHIRSSLYIDAIKKGVPSKAVHQMIKALSFDIDFQRSIKPGDRFAVLYELLVDPKNKTADVGRLLMANMHVDSKPITIYFYDRNPQNIGFFHKDGKSIQKTLLKTPIDGARISSGFGHRKHPILGFTKHHKGVDFAAPTGTPIFAAGSGTIEVAGRKSGYGNYVRIRHSMSNFKTAYAHLSRFAKGVRSGKFVKQGEIIGYVGATGRATGPHLHYEIIRNGIQINPQSVKMESNLKLAGRSLKEYMNIVEKLETLIERAKRTTETDTLRIQDNFEEYLFASTDQNKGPSKS